MADLLRKGFLLGLGAAVSGKEKLQEKLKELVDKNELTQEQARTVLNNFIDKGEDKKSEWDEKQQEKTDKMVSDLGIATKTDIETLQMRIQELEEKLSQ